MQKTNENISPVYLNIYEIQLVVSTPSNNFENSKASLR